MKELTLNDVKRTASTLQGQTLETLSWKRPFHFEVEPNGFAYTPERSGIRRLNDWRSIQRVLDHFNETGSLRPSAYINITRNASYLLVIISATH